MVRHGSANAPVFERTQTHAACFASRPLTVSVNLCRHCGASLVVSVLLGVVVIWGRFAFPVGLRTAESFNQTVSRFCGARSAPRSLSARGYTPERRLGGFAAEVPPPIKIRHTYASSLCSVFCAVLSKKCAVLQKMTQNENYDV